MKKKTKIGIDSEFYCLKCKKRLKHVRTSSSFDVALMFEMPGTMACLNKKCERYAIVVIGGLKEEE